MNPFSDLLSGLRMWLGHTYPVEQVCLPAIGRWIGVSPINGLGRRATEEPTSSADKRKSRLRIFAAQAACILSAAILSSADSYANADPRPNAARSSVEGDTPGAVTLPQFMRENGYHTYSIGKVFDDSSDTAERSWSEPPVVPGGDSGAPRASSMYNWGDFSAEGGKIVLAARREAK